MIDAASWRASTQSCRLADQTSLFAARPFNCLRLVQPLRRSDGTNAFLTHCDKAACMRIAALIFDDVFELADIMRTKKAVRPLKSLA